MIIAKNNSGIYVARVDTPHGKRTINLRSSDRATARKIAKETRIAEVELVSQISLVRKETLAQIVLGRKVPASEALSEWKEWLSARLSAKQVHNLSTLISSFLRETMAESQHVHCFSEKQLDSWINGHSNAKASTRSLKLSALRKFFEFCSVRNYCVSNPAAELRVDLSILRHDQKESRTRTPISDEQYEMILKGYEKQALEPGADLQSNLFWRCAVQLAWHTGLRLGDICQLEWDSISEPMTLIVWTDKTNARVEHRLKPALSALLRSIPQRHNRFVFPEQQATYADIRKRSNFSVEFSRFLKSLCIIRLSFHCLRYAFASRSDRIGIPMDRIRQSMGHSNVNTTIGYARS